MAERASIRFVALMAYLVSCVALGIDLMLASLPEIGNELSPAAPERATLVMGSFFISLGFATFLVGPILDRFGRKPVMLAGLGLYALGGLLSWLAPSLTLMLLGRALMGIGAAAPRVGVQAIIRDRFEGRQMAATISLVMMIFTLVPGVAPMLGAWIAELTGWRGVFAVFIFFGLSAALWFVLQQPETLKEPIPISLRSWAEQVRASMSIKMFRLSLYIQLFAFASLYGLLTAGPAIFTDAYDIPGLYPYIFGAVSVSGALGSFANARLVARIGMVRLLRRGLVVCTLATLVGLIGLFAGLGLPAFLLAMFSAFFVLGFVVGNSQALALQPFGKSAGTASATLVAAATLGAGALAIPIPLFFSSEPIPMILAQLLFCLLGLWAAFGIEKD
ncbi:MAG: MFS transporter [Pseudomonadota bacterium]